MILGRDGTRSAGGNLQAIRERAVKDLEARFTEVEKRVTALVTDNAGSGSGSPSSSRSWQQARAEAGELQNLHGKQLHIREKIEKVLQSLEAHREKGT